MNNPKKSQEDTETKARAIFNAAPEQYKEVIKKILNKERDVMHLLRRNDIHQNIYDIIRQNIK